MVGGAGRTLASAQTAGQKSLKLVSVAGAPSLVAAYVETERVQLTRHGTTWQAHDIELELIGRARGFDVSLRSPKKAVMRVHLRWSLTMAAGMQYLADDWERSYANLAWRGLEPERVMPWYFLANNGKTTVACGVRTAPAALCFWQVDPEGVSLWLDVRNGGRGVALGQRQLAIATICIHEYEDRPFEAAKQFCSLLCDKPRLPSAPVYGGNNWYYAYGKSSAADIRSDSERVASWASDPSNRPVMVIDDGWEEHSVTGPWRGNRQFPDMAGLAADMKRIGVQPGLWIRPLFTKESVPEGWRLKTENAGHEYAEHKAYTLDPTVPEAIAQISEDFRRAVAWGYGLIKHDFSTYDLLGRWGFAMGAQVTDSDWNFADRTRTNAEIIRGLYQSLRDAVGSAMLLGCNTVGHLGAGLFELQRIGDDTSGRDWNRTRKMGVNTLAFRAPQHGTFFAIDADCVGLTTEVPWSLNRQWLDLLARSGTPLFVSAAPAAVGPEQRAALSKAFATASQLTTLGEPLDWMMNTEPQEWKLQGKRTSYRWFGTEGGSPLAS